MLMNCHLWITLSQMQDLLIVERSFINEDNEAVVTKIIKGQKSNDETSPEPTELRLVGCLTGSMCTPSKSNMLTPKTNSQTC